MQIQRIIRFDGPFGFLSNFTPAKVMLDAIEYPTVEHAYQAAKTLDPVGREVVRKMPTPATAKRAGKKVAKRSDWTVVKNDVMLQLLRQKFVAGSRYANMLLNTGNAEPGVMSTGAYVMASARTISVAC